MGTQIKSRASSAQQILHITNKRGTGSLLQSPKSLPVWNCEQRARDKGMRLLAKGIIFSGSLDSMWSPNTRGRNSPRSMPAGLQSVALKSKREEVGFEKGGGWSEAQQASGEKLGRDMSHVQHAGRPSDWLRAHRNDANNWQSI